MHALQQGLMSPKSCSSQSFRLAPLPQELLAYQMPDASMKCNIESQTARRRTELSECGYVWTCGSQLYAKHNDEPCNIYTVKEWAQVQGPKPWQYAATGFLACVAIILQSY